MDKLTVIQRPSMFLPMLFGTFPRAPVPSPQMVVRPPWHPPQPSSQEVVGALGSNYIACKSFPREVFEWTKHHHCMDHFAAHFPIFFPWAVPHCPSPDLLVGRWTICRKAAGATGSRGTWAVSRGLRRCRPVTETFLQNPVSHA